MNADSTADSASLARAERIVRACFGSIEFACVNVAQDVAVFFINTPFLTYENFFRWESPEVQRALPTELSCHIAPYYSVFYKEPILFRVDECTWQHGYFDQLLRGPRYTHESLIGQPYQTIYMDCIASSDPLAPTGMQRMDLEDIRHIYAFNEHRSNLFDDFDILLGYVRNLFGAVNAVWLAGSFASSKEHPGDLDAVFVIDSRLYRAAEADPKKKRLLNALHHQSHKTKLNMDVHAIFIQDVPEDIRNAARGSSDELSQNTMERGSWLMLFKQDTQSRPDFEQANPPTFLRGILEAPVDSLADVERAVAEVERAVADVERALADVERAVAEVEQTIGTTASPQVEQRYLYQDSERFKEIVRHCAEEEGVPVQDIIQEYFAFLILEQIVACRPESVLKGGLSLKRVHHLINRRVGDMDIALISHGENLAEDAFSLVGALNFAVEKVGLRFLQYINDVRMTHAGMYFVALPDFGFDNCGYLKIELSFEAPVIHAENTRLQSSAMRWLESQSGTHTSTQACVHASVQSSAQSNAQASTQASVQSNAQASAQSGVQSNTHEQINGYRTGAIQNETRQGNASQNHAGEEYLDAPFFSMPTQTVEAAFCDKILALCNAPLRPLAPFYGKSRHLYDLYCLMQHLELDKHLFTTLQEVRAQAPRYSFFAAEQEDFDIAGALRDLYWTQVYRHDYQRNLASMLPDETPYDVAANVLLQIADWLCAMTGDVPTSPADYAAQYLMRARINRAHVRQNLEAAQANAESGQDGRILETQTNTGSTEDGHALDAQSSAKDSHALVTQINASLIADSCYNIHQCIELCMKAALVLLGTGAPKTHSLADLNDILQYGKSLFSEAVHEDLRRLIPLCVMWETDARYQPKFAPIDGSLELACNLADAMLAQVSAAAAAMAK